MTCTINAYKNIGPPTYFYNAIDGYNVLISGLFVDSFSKICPFEARGQDCNQIDRQIKNRGRNELKCGQRVELFQMYRTNRTVTCDESSYGLNTS